MTARMSDAHWSAQRLALANWDGEFEMRVSDNAPYMNSALVETEWLVWRGCFSLDAPTCKARTAFRSGGVDA